MKRDDKEPGSQRGVPRIFSSPSVPTARPRQKAQDCPHSFRLICLKTCVREASGARQTPPSPSSHQRLKPRHRSLPPNQPSGTRGDLGAFLESRGSRPEPGAFSSRPNSGGHARSGAAPSARTRGRGTNPHCIFPPSPPGRETPRRGHSGPHAARRKPRFLPAGSSSGPPRRAGSAAAPRPPAPARRPSPSPASPRPVTPAAAATSTNPPQHPRRASGAPALQARPPHLRAEPQRGQAGTRSACRDRAGDGACKRECVREGAAPRARAPSRALQSRRAGHAPARGARGAGSQAPPPA